MVGVERKWKKRGRKGRVWEALWRWSFDPEGFLWLGRKLKFLFIGDMHACERLGPPHATFYGSSVPWVAAKDKYNVEMESEAGESHFFSRIPHSGSQLGIHSTEITLCQVSGHRRYSVISWSSEPSPPSASLPWPCLDCSQHRIPWVASLPAVWANAS